MSQRTLNKYRLSVGNLKISDKSSSNVGHFVDTKVVD